MYTVRKATINDREVISKIWSACFAVDQAYIDSYLDHCFPYCKSYFLLPEKEGPVSFLSVIPSYISRGAETVTGGYIYSVATLPDYRGRGYARTLIEEVTRICKNSGYSYLVVKPADPSLFSYYKDLNFNIPLRSGEMTITRESFSSGASLSFTTAPLTGKILHKLRLRSLSSHYFLTIPKIVQYAVMECESRGGLSSLISKESVSPTSSLYCLAYPDENDQKKIIIIETNAKNSKDKDMVVAHLFEHYKDAESVVYRTHPSLFASSSDAEILTTELALLIKKDCKPVVESRFFSLPLE